MTLFEWIKSISILWLIIAVGTIAARYNATIKAEGIAKAAFLDYYHGITITASEARVLTVAIHATDIVISPAELNVWDGDDWNHLVPKISADGSVIK